MSGASGEPPGEAAGSAQARGPTRRQVLLGLGAAGGGGAVLGALAALGLTERPGSSEWTPPRRSDFALQGRVNGETVLVLGAGVTGLCCAYELEKAGYRVTVLDARERVGGRSLTLRHGTSVQDTRGVTQTARFARGRWFDAGPGRIAQHHLTLDYCRELGVPVEVFVNENPDAFIESRGTVRRRRAAQADLDGYVSELLSKAVLDGALDDTLAEDERAALVRHLRDAGVLGTARRGYDVPPGPDGGAGQVGEPDDLATLLRLGLGPRLAFERDWDMAMPMFHIVGGMDGLVGALADALRDPVRTGVSVRAARRRTDGGDGVAVTATESSGRTVSFTADHGICCLPPHLAARLDGSWDPPVTRALAEPQPFVTGKIALEYDRRFWEQDDRILGGITVTSREPRVIWYPSEDILGRGGVLVGAYPFGPAASRFSRLSHAARQELALEAGTAVHGPVYRDELVSSVSVDWLTQPHSEGAWSTWRRYGADYDRLLGPTGRWWFAGDWLSRSPGWQHGALLSARRAVTGVHQVALST